MNICIGKAIATIDATGTGSYDSNLRSDAAATSRTTLGTIISSSGDNRISFVTQGLLVGGTKTRIDASPLSVIADNDTIRIFGACHIFCNASGAFCVVASSPNFAEIRKDRIGFIIAAASGPTVTIQ